jgi:hypothetical protein
MMSATGSPCGPSGAATIDFDLHRGTPLSAVTGADSKCLRRLAASVAMPTDAAQLASAVLGRGWKTVTRWIISNLSAL